MLVIGLLLASAAEAQLADEFAPPRANCCLATTAKGLADQLQDWNQLGRYHRANEQLKSQPADPQRVVFMGDSITDLWRLEEYFPGKPYVNRGIGGQTTPQMLVRMYPDVIDLKPAVMVLLAGTNDIARNTGPMTAEMIQHNIMAMTELAQRHGIKVILCSVLPVSDYKPRPMTDGRPPADILKLNRWLRDYASQVNAIYVDYFTAVVDDKGWLTDAYSGDGLHPNAQGYKVMAPLVAAAIQKALP